MDQTENIMMSKALVVRDTDEQKESTMVATTRKMKPETLVSPAQGDCVRKIWPDGRLETIPLMEEYDGFEVFLEKYAAQQTQLSALEKEFVEYKQTNDKRMQVWLFDRFEGINKNEVMTQFSCKWFGILMLCHLIFYWLYYVVREGSHLIAGGADEKHNAMNPERTVDDDTLAIILYCVAYLFMVLFDIFWHTIFPDIVRCERTTAQTHVIVAAHRAHDSLEVMLPTVLKTFAPECIWVADNGFRDYEAEALCNRLGIHYEYNDIGNKANALVVVARKIQRLYQDNVKNVVLLDDDTELADDFFIRHDLLSREDVGGYCVGIAVNRSPPFNIWETAIDFEYRAISHSFGARATCSSIPFCHGICAVYKLDLMVDLYSKNCSLPGGLPFGEDGYAGLDYRMAGYKLLQDNHNVVMTFCPRSFFPPMFSKGRVQGYGASSLWKQRAWRWFLSWPRRLPREIWLVFTYQAGSWYGNLQYRIYFLWSHFLNCVSVAWIPYMVYVWLKKESWALLFLLKALLSVTGILVTTLRIIAFPPKLRKGIHPLTPLCTPILGVANTVLRFFSFFFSIYWFIPFYRVNEVRVLGDTSDADDEESGESTSNSSPEYGHEEHTETEEPTETEASNHELGDVHDELGLVVSPSVATETRMVKFVRDDNTKSHNPLLKKPW